MSVIPVFRRGRKIMNLMQPGLHNKTLSQKYKKERVEGRRERRRKEREKNM
jgi:hypothetical protein